MSEFISLGLGRYVRADRIVALEPIEGDERGPGRRTRVWIDGRQEPLIASRSESALVAELDDGAPAARGEARRITPAPRDEPPSLF